MRCPCGRNGWVRSEAARRLIEAGVKRRLKP
jgi:hypothetical protein